MRIRALCRLAVPLLALPTLACPSAEVRLAQNLARIAEIEDQRDSASPELETLIRHQDPGIRQRAVVALGRIQAVDEVDLLAEAISDPDDSVAQAAVFAMGQLGLRMGASIPPQAPAAVLPWLEDSRPARVALAVEALGKLAVPDTSERLIDLAQHPDAEVRTEVAHALFRLRFAPRWRGEVTVEPDPTTAARETIIALLGDAEPGPRRAAAHALSRLPDPGAGLALIEVLDDPDEWIRFFALRALGRLGVDAPATAAPAIAAVATDPSALVRREAIVALGALKSIDLAPIDAARDPSHHVRAALAGALATDRNDDTLSLLRQLESADRSRQVRLAGLPALAHRLGPAVEPLLRERLASEDPLIRAAAATSLTSLDLELRCELAATALADPSRTVRVAALEAHGALACSAAALETALTSEDLAERGAAVAVVAGSELLEQRTAWLRRAFADSRGDEWIELREAVVDALSEHPELLAEAARDPAAAVRARAGAALRRLGTEPPLVETAAGPTSSFLTSPPPRRPVVAFETQRGVIEIEGLDEAAPLHVASLLALVEAGFYDGLTLHRVVPGFVVQGGDPRGDGWGGPDFQLRDEISRVRLERGMVGMAKAGKDTGGSQFFITLAPTPHLDGNYTVYGRVVAGMEVVDSLEVGDRIVRATRVR